MEDDNSGVEVGSGDDIYIVVEGVGEDRREEVDALAEELVIDEDVVGVETEEEAIDEEDEVGVDALVEE